METKSIPCEFSLTTLLAHRQRLPPAEILQLLATLPALLDERETSGFSGSLADEIFVVFPAYDCAFTDCLERPLAEWPPFALDWRSTPDTHSHDTARPLSPFLVDLPSRLAGLIYELAGGDPNRKLNGKFQYSPIARVGEAANQLLRDLLATGSSADCRTLWRRWLSATRDHVHAAHQLEIPDWALPMGRRGRTLDLNPGTAGQPSLRFVHRTSFRIGRSRQAAELPLEVRSGRPGHDLTKHLSRTHVVARWTEQGIIFADGNGTAPSENGTSLGESKLTVQGRRLEGTEELALASDYCQCRLRVTPFPVTTPRTIVNLREWHAAPLEPPTESTPPYAAIAFEPGGDARPFRDTIWLFQEIALRLGAHGTLRHVGEADPAIAGLFAHGAFWLACLRETPLRLTVEGRPLSPGMVVPLSDQEVHFGPHPFQCVVTSD